MKKVRVGTRESALAVRQANIVIDKIHEYDPQIPVRLCKMKTSGDIILDRTLESIGGKGLFVKELDAALIEGRIDIAVHSLKDLPAQTDDNIPIVAYSNREDPRDVLILPKGSTELGGSAPIGCSSVRRRMFIKSLYPNIPIEPIRGNVLTRLEKLDRGDFSALVLAAAGIKRLGLEDRISRYFSVTEIIPAACQGVLAVQARRGEDTDYLSLFRDDRQALCAETERAFIAAVDGGCISPAAAYARLESGKIHITGCYAEPDGGEMLIKSRLIDIERRCEAAAQMAKELRDNYGR